MRENVEKKLRLPFEDYRYGTTIWSPLAGGIFSGKYNDGVTPEGSRYCESVFAKAAIWPKYFGESKKENTLKILKGLKEIAAELGWTQAQLALAWTIVNKDTSTCIFGATNEQQVEDNIKSLKVAQNWTPELEDRIEAVLGNQPEPSMDWNVWAPKTSRRKLVIDYEMKPSDDAALMKKMKAAMEEKK